MRISSPAFENNQAVPERFSCRGRDINPGLKIEGVPAAARSLVLIVDDPDAPTGTFVHWVVYDIPALTVDIREGSVPGIQGTNSAGKDGYMGPCPPSGTHRYFFKVYALDTTLSLKQRPVDKQAVESAMAGHILDSTQLMGTFSYR